MPRSPVPMPMPRDVPRLAPRPADAHKGMFGHVLLLAGSRGMAGAACLATLAALRSGVGLVTCATPQSAQPTVAARAIAAMTWPLPEADGGHLDAYAALRALPPLLARATAVAMGPGLTTATPVRTLLTHVLEYDLAATPASAEPPLPVVLDADALNVLAAMRDALPALLPAGRPTVLTPHPKEFARLAGVEMADVLAEPEAVGRAFLRDKPGVTLVLKSHRTLVLQRDEPVWASPHPGNGGLAKGGTGDVLTGLLGGLLAQGYAARDAAVLAVHLHARAGAACAQAVGTDAMTAEDLLGWLPYAFREHRGEVGGADGS